MKKTIASFFILVFMIPFASEAMAFKKAINSNFQEVNKEKLKNLVKEQISFSNFYKNKLLTLNEDKVEAYKIETQNLINELNGLENPSTESIEKLAGKMGFNNYEHLNMEFQKLANAKHEFIEMGGFGGLSDPQIISEVESLVEDEEVINFIDDNPCKNPKGEAYCDLGVLGGYGLCLLKYCTKAGPFTIFCAAMCTAIAVAGFYACYKLNCL